MGYWVLAADPRRFRVVDSIANEETAWWRTGGSPIARGDRVAIWKYRGSDEHRGIVALGEVISEPEIRAAASPYWIGDAEPLAEAAPRVLIRYVKNPSLPLWLTTDRGSVVGELSVARAQGGPAFHMADAQWARLMEEIGGWSPRRNPPWSRDELILALDLYLRRRPEALAADDLEVVELSGVLNALPIHTLRPDEEKFRSPEGLAMKLGSFAAIDAAYPGIGPTSGGRDEVAVWDRFQTVPEELVRLAEQLRDLAASGNAPASAEEDEDGIDEGRILFRMHRTYERDRALHAKKARGVLHATGRLACEICGFDFSQTYGPDVVGEFIEIHHLIPLHEVGNGGKARLVDLAAVCSNCHRVLHRSKPWLRPDELRKRLAL